MKGVTNYFSISKEYADLADISFETEAILIHSVSNEERSALSDEFKKKHPNVELIYVEEIGYEQIKLLNSNTEIYYNLRSKSNLADLTNKFNDRSVYLDFTGLTHNSWAWLIRGLLYRKKGSLWALYSEPYEYKLHETPLDGQIFDLSEKINGLAPLAGLARLTNYRTTNFLFMPLLGFEGTRLSYIMEDVQPTIDLTFPVIGVPGFRVDFPFYTYQGNRLTLEKENIWKNWRYEKANCPASVYVLGKGLLNEYKNMILRIAPIGTKPHALGAVLLKLAYPLLVDLIYDHPIRKKGRTSGKSKTLSYWLNPFIEEISPSW